MNSGNFNLRSQISLGDLDDLLFEMFSWGPLTGGLKAEDRGEGQPGGLGGSVVRCTDSRPVGRGESGQEGHLAAWSLLVPGGPGGEGGLAREVAAAGSCPERCVATPSNARFSRGSR